MTGFTVYSASDDPDPLYSTDGTESIDADATAAAVWASHRPLDFVVDFGRNCVWWTLEADYQTKATRTGYFIAAYQSDEDLFQGLADGLSELHKTDAWTINSGDTLVQDAGFEMWRIPAEVNGEYRAAFDQLVDYLEGDNRNLVSLVVGMESYQTAFQVIRALGEANLSCTVAVDSKDSLENNREVDLLLVPGADHDFTVQSPKSMSLGAETVEEPISPTSTSSTSVSDVDENPVERTDALSPTDSAVSEPTTGDIETQVSQDKSVADGVSATDSHPVPNGAESPPTGTSSLTVNGFITRIAAVVLVGLLGFSIYSFVSSQPVHPISGLAAFGGFFGTAIVLRLQHRDAQRVRLRPPRSFQAWLKTHSSRVVLTLTLGTGAGFLFPRIAWQLGIMAGQGGFLLGPIIRPGGAIVSVTAYVSIAFVVTAAVLTLSRERWRTPDGMSLRRLGLDFGIYGLCLLVATGFADILWYSILPSVN